MFLRELFEAPKKVAVVAFGRMNPPTIGHEKLVDKIKSFNGDHYVFLSQTQKPKDNPLPFDVKLEFAKKFFPGVNVGHPTVRTPIQMLQMLEKLGYTDIIYVAGSDRVASFDKLFNDYNGKEYNFNSITVENAGERDPDADGAEGMSASKMRAAAASGDYDSFAQGVPTPALAEKLYDAVRNGMGVKDEVPANEILGFATKSPKRNVVKRRPPEPEEDSVQDKIKKRRAMKSKGNPDAFKTGAVK
jgi:nicotinic acid mononucleotide adenylyltransferase